jgi:hypothetical protein
MLTRREFHYLALGTTAATVSLNGTSVGSGLVEKNGSSHKFVQKNLI